MLDGHRRAKWGKGGKNIPGEEGAEAKPQLVVVRDAWPLLGAHEVMWKEMKKEK